MKHSCFRSREKDFFTQVHKSNRVRRGTQDLMAFFHVIKRQYNKPTSKVDLKLTKKRIRPMRILQDSEGFLSPFYFPSVRGSIFRLTKDLHMYLTVSHCNGIKTWIQSLCNRLGGSINGSYIL